MRNKKIIFGIYTDSYENKVGLTLPYINFFSMFGKVIFLTHDNFDVLKNVYDILVVPGGADILSNNDNNMSFSNGRANPYYEFLDKHVLAEDLKNKKPVIGICRGFQTINVALGGTLYPNVVGHLNSVRTSKTEILSIFDNEIFQEPTYIKINSIHHQAIDRLGNGLKPLGFTKANDNCYSVVENNLFNLNRQKLNIFVEKNLKYEKKENYYFVEVFEGIENPILGFQYHPEEINCEYAINKIQIFIEKNL